MTVSEKLRVYKTRLEAISHYKGPLVLLVLGIGVLMGRRCFWLLDSGSKTAAISKKQLEAFSQASIEERMLELQKIQEVDKRVQQIQRHPSSGQQGISKDLESIQDDLKSYKDLHLSTSLTMLEASLKDLRDKLENLQQVSIHIDLFKDIETYRKEAKQLQAFIDLIDIQPLERESFSVAVTSILSFLDDYEGIFEHLRVFKKGSSHIQDVHSISSFSNLKELYVNVDDLNVIPSDGNCLYYSLYTFCTFKGLISEQEFPTILVFKEYLIDYLEDKWKNSLKPLPLEKRMESPTFQSLAYVYEDLRGPLLKGFDDLLLTKKYLYKDFVSCKEKEILKQEIEALELEIQSFKNAYPEMDGSDYYIEKSFELMRRDRVWGGTEILYAFMNWLCEEKHVFFPIVYLETGGSSKQVSKDFHHLFKVTKIFKSPDKQLVTKSPDIRWQKPLYLWYENGNHYNLYYPSLNERKG